MYGWEVQKVHVGTTCMYVPILSMYYYRYIHVWYSRGTTLRHRGIIIDVRDGWGCEKLKTGV